MTSREERRHTQIVTCIVSVVCGLENMPSSCSVNECSGKATTWNRRVFVFGYPLIPKFIKSGLKNVTGKTNLILAHVICSNHFSPEQFDDVVKLYLLDTNSIAENCQPKLKLRPEAVPDCNFPTASDDLHSELKNEPELPSRCSKSKFAK